LPGSAQIPVVFKPVERAVSNWQAEAIDNLDLSSETKAKLDSSADLQVPRCVKLNNYWCIKRARWAGEIAADADGHVAFASAIEGAAAAAQLLRRYYLDYNRHSALAIVSHWAPAWCAGASAPSRPRKPGAPDPAAFTAIAPFGLQNTLRARWLAAHRPTLSGPAKTKALPRSIVHRRPLLMMRAPEIAVGMGEPQRTPLNIAALEFAAPAPEPSAGTCSSESTRIRNYASRAIEGIVKSPEDDLLLFPANGMPGPNLLRLLENMAKVEIGPLAVRADLIAAAIARLAPSEEKGVPKPAGAVASEMEPSRP
jgi:hypothetical protein